MSRNTEVVCPCGERLQLCEGAYLNWLHKLFYFLIVVCRSVSTQGPRRRALSTLIHSHTEKAEISEIVERLVADRLLVASQDQESGQEMVEIIHDAVLWEWELLRQWLEDDRRFLVWRQELERRVRAWVETNPADPSERDPYKRED